jgi:hypothetical protein
MLRSIYAGVVTSVQKTDSFNQRKYRAHRGLPPDTRMCNNRTIEN